MSEALHGKLNQNSGALGTNKQPHKYSNMPPQATHKFYPLVQNLSITHLTNKEIVNWKGDNA